MKPEATATVKFDIGNNTFPEHFAVVKNLSGPITGLHFTRLNSVVINSTESAIHYRHYTMQFEGSCEQTSAKLQSVLTGDTLTTSFRTAKTSTAFVDHPTEIITTGTVIPLRKITKTESLLISHSLWTLIGKEMAVRVSNTTKSIFSSTQRGQFSHQKEPIKYRVVRSRSAAVRVYQTRVHGNHQYDSRRWSGSDHLPESTP